jgi:hypothetical protein
MARTNYQMVRRRKEAERKNRRDAKLARRTQKGADGPAIASDESPPNAAPPAENALK